MEDYETHYKEYKNALLKSAYFMDKFKETYKNTLSAENDFIDKNGVLAKVGTLSAIGGLCFGLFFSLEGANHIAGIIIRCILAIGAVVCFFLAIHIASDYKKASGKSNFYSFVYDKYIEDRVREDKQMETDALLRDILKKLDSIQWRSERLEKGSKIDAEQLQSDLLHIITKLDDFPKRYDDLSRYDRFAKDLMDDYHLSKAIHEHID